LFGSHRASESSLSVEAEDHRLNIGDDGLDLADDHDTTSWVEGEDVDRTAFATDRERDFNAYVVTEGLKSPNHNVDDRSVGLIEQPVQTLAMPADRQLDLGVDRLADRVQRAERDPADAAQLDPADRVLRDPCSSGDVALAEALPAAQRTDRAAEANHVHARTMLGRPYPALHTELPRCTV
jgi:hypothetical protein